jgi:hypothetical protein
MSFLQTIYQKKKQTYDENNSHQQDAEAYIKGHHLQRQANSD